MLIDDLQEQLKLTEPDLATITAYYHNTHISQRFNELTTMSNQPDFWQHPDQASILKELQRVRIQHELYQHLIKTKEELQELLALFNSEEQELAKLKPEIATFLAAVHSF